MPFIVATYVYASSQGQRTHSARTKNDEVRNGALTVDLHLNPALKAKLTDGARQPC